MQEIDIYRSAKLLIDQHGEDAPIFAAMQADKCLEAGDLDGKAVWLRVFMVIVSMLIAVLVASGLSIITHSKMAFGQSEPLEKFGNCPAGYYINGNFCMPGRYAQPAIRKIGNCPNGYWTNGSYCVAGFNAKPALRKTGTCPTGYITSGNYCLKNE